jgi:pimeloyl-ACP methyl ester carboxylesterase
VGASETAGAPAVQESRDGGWELLTGGAGVSPGAAEPEHRVLMVPANMATAEFFRDMVADPALAAARVQAVAGTPPGFGGLPVPREFDFSVAALAELIEDRAAAGGFDLVVAHSLSGNALVDVAVRGNYEGRLVLVAPTLRASSEVQAAHTLNRMSRLPILSGTAWFGMMRGLGIGMRGQLPADRHGELVAEMRRNPTRSHKRWLIATFDQLAGGHTLAPDLAGVTRAGDRVTLVRGAEDPVELHPDDEATLTAVGIDVVTIPDAGHFVVAQRPAEVNAVVLRALGLEPRPPAREARRRKAQP